MINLDRTCFNNSWADLPKVPQELFISNDSNSKNCVKITDYEKEECERKSFALISKIEEKIGENNFLSKQQKELEGDIDRVELKIKNHSEYNDSPTIDTEENKILTERLKTMRESLLMQAIENIEMCFQLIKIPDASELAIKIVKKNCTREDQKEILLKAECLRLRKRKESYDEAEDEYEAEIRAISVILSNKLVISPVFLEDESSTADEMKERNPISLEDESSETDERNLINESRNLRNDLAKEVRRRKIVEIEVEKLNKRAKELEASVNEFVKNT